MRKKRKVSKMTIDEAEIILRGVAKLYDRGSDDWIVVIVDRLGRKILSHSNLEKPASATMICAESTARLGMWVGDANFTGGLYNRIDKDMSATHDGIDIEKSIGTYFSIKREGKAIAGIGLLNKNGGDERTKKRVLKNAVKNANLGLICTI
jgi:hypothetical protein